MTVLRELLAAGRRLQSLWWRLIARPMVVMQGVEVGRGVRFLGLPIVTMKRGSRVAIGERSMLCSVSSHTALGVMHPVILRTLTPYAVIMIGADTGISGVTICAANSVTIGSQVLLGANVVIADTDFHPITPKNRRYETNSDRICASPVIIGDNVFIGMNSIILKGSEIGRDSIIGAGSVVIGLIPPRVLAAGNPARIIREL